MADVQSTGFDSIGFDTHTQYARGQENLNAWQRHYHMPAKGLATAITPSELAKVVPQPPAVDLVTGRNIRTSPIRYTLPPTFADSRPREPLSRLGPEERMAADMDKLSQFVKTKHPGDAAVQEQSEALMAMYGAGLETKQLYYTINANMLQFIQA